METTASSGTMIPIYHTIRTCQKTVTCKRQ